MLDSFKEESRHALIWSYLSRQQIKNKEKTKIQTNSEVLSLKKIEINNFQAIEAQIKQFDYQQVKDYPSMIIQENHFCEYTFNRTAKFLCSNQYCNKYAIICGEQNCKCYLDHRKCSFVQINGILERIRFKLLQPLPKQISHYFQVKQVIYQHMLNRIVQERQFLSEWQQEFRFGSKKILSLYGFRFQQSIVCHEPKLLYKQNYSLDHFQKCGCFPIGIHQISIQTYEQQNLKQICNQIYRKYAVMEDLFYQKIDQLKYNKECANLNPAQILLIEFFTNKHELCWKDSEKNLQSIVNFDRSYRKKCLKDAYFDKLNVNKLTKAWKGYSEQLFRLFVEGKAVSDLFAQVKKANHLRCQSVQQIKSYIDKIIQGISQQQEQFFKVDKSKKTIQIANLDQTYLKSDLKRYQGNNKYDQIYIKNDRCNTAINNIETIKELGKLINITKLQIKWCFQMRTQVSEEILKRMPHLKQLALLGYCQNLSGNFMKMLYQLKQLTSLCISPYNHPDFYIDQIFISFKFKKVASLFSSEELLELSKKPKLENIQISKASEVKSAEIVKNMKALKHLTLGQIQSQRNGVYINLMTELLKQKSLRTLSLIGIKFYSGKANQIIIKNPFLKTIIIKNPNFNDSIDDETVECMSNLIQLQTLCIQFNRAITGQHLIKLDSLKVLQLRSCDKISNFLLQKALKEMHKLKNLDIAFNCWVDDALLISVSQCKQLECLNIQQTSVSGKGIMQLKELAHLNILICGCNSINGKDLIELTNYTPKMTRLGIKNCILTDDDLLRISAKCQQITHLNIIKTNIKPETLLKMTQLKVVKSNFDYKSTNQLISAGIKVSYP